MKYDKKYSDALRNLALALQKVAELCDGDEMGIRFNNEVISDRLGKCWALSVDEMADKVLSVADSLNSLGEDKQRICDNLAKTLQTTHNASDLVSLTYNPADESVEILFESGGKRRVNVAMDSGTAMIRDIMNGLGC